MDFSNRHLTELKLSFGAALPYTSDNLICIALHAFLLQRMLPLLSLVAFIFRLCVSFFLCLSLIIDFFCNYNLVIFVIFFTFSFAALEITFLPLYVNV